MKKVEATISLLALGIEGMNVSEAKSLRPRAQPGWFRGSQYVVWFAPRYKIELVVPDSKVADCVEAIRACAPTDDADSVTIVVLPVEDAIRIRTGDHLAHAA